MAKSLKPGKGPLDYTSHSWLKATFIITYIVLYLPIFVLILFSFKLDKNTSIWKGLTLKNYVTAWNNKPLFDSLVNSLTIAFAATIISTLIGAMVAVLLWRFRFPGKASFEATMGLPIVIPEICMGVALQIFFNMTGLMTGVLDFPWPFSLVNVICAHVAFCFPFVAVVVRSRLVGFNRELEEASKDLGASEWQTFWKIIVPYMKPGLVAGALLAFTLSLDDFVITFFTSGPNTNTFPVKIYSQVRRSISLEINAASTVLIIITVIATVLAMKLQTANTKAKE